MSVRAALRIDASIRTCRARFVAQLSTRALADEEGGVLCLVPQNIAGDVLRRTSAFERSVLVLRASVDVRKDAGMSVFSPGRAITCQQA
jgi:hypothetical protein